ncbi:MAG: hybrid sensor histidine kinase/response regulator [bacterium]|nr:hybrid sensor histidine kinase/response regulator [bacterium]
MSIDVLLVDDETEILNILRDTISTAGFQVSTKENGQAALSYLSEHEPEVMVTDLRMPGLSGMELFQQIRECLPDLQVIILTGFGDMKSAVEALRLGAYDYLNKPVDADRLIQVIRRASERRRLVLENRALIQSLSEANRLKTEFLHGMSHEIRTPLGHITGFSEILESTLENLTEKQVRYLGNIQKAAIRLLNMFDNMLEYSDLSSGGVYLSPSDFLVSGCLAKVREVYQDAAGAKSITIDIQTPENLEVHADETVCQKVLSLLLDNAIGFSPQDTTVTLNAESKDALDVTLASTLDAPGPWLHLSVSDKGPGIPAEDQERIFNLFEQADGSLSRQHEGTGLGLALAKNLAKIHGGALTLDSTPGEGSTFTLVIPVSPNA